jgi:hypothetical protein
MAQLAADGTALDQRLTWLCAVAVEARGVDGATVMAERDSQCRVVAARRLVFTDLA